MEKLKTKKFNISVLLKCISLVLIALSVLAYFLPFITYAPAHLSTVTHYSGFDFTMAHFGNQAGIKFANIQNFFQAENVGLISKLIAILGLVCTSFSVVVFVLTLLSLFFKKCNNVIVLAFYFVGWVALGFCVVTFVGSMAVTRGELVINNYQINYGIIVSALSVLTSSVFNIFANLVAE